MFFQSLSISKWQQFSDVRLVFHDRVTVITGANGSGKTTLLNLLSRHAGWNQLSLGTPRQEKSGGVIRWFYNWFKTSPQNNEVPIGELQYSDDSRCELLVPKANSPTYSVTLRGQKQLRCFYVPSHRSVFRYEPLSSIPTVKKGPDTAFQEVSNRYRDLYQGGGGQPSSFLMKNTLIGWAIAGYGVGTPEKWTMYPDAEQRALFEGFQETLRQVLPASLGFKELEIRNYEIVFVCNEGDDEFILETASGGISTLIDIAWQVFSYSVGSKEFTVLIDEVENHLHPSMQRRLLPDLINAFPQARFIVTTHSPLVVGSVANSRVYVLRYDNSRKVVSTQLDLEEKAKSATELLDEVLGVSSSMPIWAEQRLAEVLAKYMNRSLRADDFGALRRELSAIGLERLVPQAVAAIAERAS